MDPRVSVLLLAFSLLVPCMLGSPVSGPLIHFSLYAPNQKSSPVHIVGINHDKSELRFVLSNTSDKTVSTVVIAKIDIAPRGCTTQPERGRETFWLVKGHHPGGFSVNIAPHSKNVTAGAGIYMLGTPRPKPNYPHWPRSMVNEAKSAGAGYMQFQFGVTAVFFQDGTTWPDGISFLAPDKFDASRARTPVSPEEDAKIHAVLSPEVFDPSLAENEAAKCASPMAVANALQSVKETVFDVEVPGMPEPRSDTALPPHLRFSCSLDGEKAICHMPLEKASP